MPTLPPLLMRPAYVEKLWGGTRIGQLPAKRLHPPPTGAIGESWEVADLPEGQSHVEHAAVCAPYAGAALGELVQRYGADLIGTSARPGRFPILVKIIDAAEPLSVQVHPGADYAATHEGVHSKDEAWLIIDVDDGGEVLHGFVDGVDRALFIDAVDKGLPHELMRKVPCARGDVLHVRPGIVHAIGAGVMVLEVQEPSDTTFRVWDFNRIDHSGQKRPLHQGQALAVADFGVQPPPLSQRVAAENGPGHILARTRSFEMAERLVNGFAEEVLLVSPERAQVLHALDDDITLTHRGISLTVPRGGTVLLPASCGEVHFPIGAGARRAIVMQ